MTALASAYQEAAGAVGAAPKILVVAHESPDGDALGSLVAASCALTAAGHDVVPYLSPAVPIPVDLTFLAEAMPIVSVLPADLDDRLVLALDCGSAARIGSEAARLGAGAIVVNVDHHHDNTLFGTVDVVDPGAACTTLMVARLLDAMGIAVGTLDLVARQALYVGLVTDTGRFQYSNTSADALRFGADLVATGIQPHIIFRHVYESVPAEQARLVGLAVGRMRLELEARLALTTVEQSTFEAAGAREEHADGIVDVLRSIRGVDVACVLRAREEAPHVKGSMRAADGVVDVSAIARGFGGGGHPQAAGFSSEESLEDVAEAVVRAVAEAMPGR